MTTIPAPTPGLTTRELDSPPITRTIADLYAHTEETVSRVTALAGDVTDLHGSVVSNHANATSMKVDVQAQSLSGSPVTQLLDELADAGLAWRQIAMLVGVSVPAIRKWRQGGTVTGPNRLRLAHVVALLRWISNENLIDDPASWLEMPLVAGVSVSRFDLLVDGREDLVVSSLIGKETPPESLLDRYDPAWRTRFDSDFEVFTADDGLRSIRFKHDRR